MHPRDALPRWTKVPVRLAPLLLFALAWQILSALQWIDPAFLPKPTAILAALVDLLAGGEIRDNLLISLFRAAAGLVLGAASGIFLGLMMARSPTFRAYVTPVVGGTYSLPKSALIPLFILWFGIGTTTAICAVYLACLLPMIVHTYHGVAATPKVLVWSAQALGATRRELVSRIYLRHALPDVLTGLRIALGFSFVLAISSEMIASTNGIGKLIFMYGENGAYDYMFAAIFSVVIVAFVADRLFLQITALCLRWHDSAIMREAA
jgi:ABC-type nitrate/sulfonate/bicarbonate transport system permease component